MINNNANATKEPSPTPIPPELAERLLEAENTPIEECEKFEW